MRPALSFYRTPSADCRHHPYGVRLLFAPCVKLKPPLVPDNVPSRPCTYDPHEAERPNWPFGTVVLLGWSSVFVPVGLPR